MNKLKIGILFIISVLFITACSCSKGNFVVTFDSNGGSVVPSQKVEKGKSATIPKNPTKKGYSFGGWFLNLKDINSYNFSSEVTKNITLKAKWIDLNAAVYTIMFDSNGGNDIGSINIEKGQEINLPVPKRSGYIFLGWYVNNTKIESTKEINTNTNLTAKWEESETKEIKASSVTFNKSTLTLAVGGSEKLKVTIKPYNTTNKKVTYKSSDEKIAKVSSSGEVTAISKGSATITATVDEKNATCKIIVESKDKVNMENAKEKIVPKTLTGPTSLKYSDSNCTITSSTPNSGKTIISGENVTKLYRSKSGGSLITTYTIKCGELTDTVSVNHKISASSYTYTAINSPGSMYYIIQISGASNYTLSSKNASNLKYNANWNGVQTDIVTHEDGIVYDMVLNSEPNTIYQVTGTTN